VPSGRCRHTATLRTSPLNPRGTGGESCSAAVRSRTAGPARSQGRWSAQEGTAASERFPPRLAALPRLVASRPRDHARSLARGEDAACGRATLRGKNQQTPWFFPRAPFSWLAPVHGVSASCGGRVRLHCVCWGRQRLPRATVAVCRHRPGAAMRNIACASTHQQRRRARRKVEEFIFAGRMDSRLRTAGMTVCAESLRGA
jgi:hypothetical protein